LKIQVLQKEAASAISVPEVVSSTAQNTDFLSNAKPTTHNAEFSRPYQHRVFRQPAPTGIGSACRGRSDSWFVKFSFDPGTAREQIASHDETTAVLGRERG